MRRPTSPHISANYFYPCKLQTGRSAYPFLLFIPRTGIRNFPENPNRRVADKKISDTHLPHTCRRRYFRKNGSGRQHRRIKTDLLFYSDTDPNRQKVWRRYSRQRSGALVYFFMLNRRYSVINQDQKFCRQKRGKTQPDTTLKNRQKTGIQHIADVRIR